MTKEMTEKKKQNLSRKKIIQAAIILFANKGFDSTSTRDICKQAGVNLSLIPYYFGNKDGLYINIIESIVNYGLTSFKDDIEKTNDLKKMSLAERIDLLKSILWKYIDFLYSENVPSSFVILMIKEQAVSHSKFSQIYSQKINILYNALRKTLASILNKKNNDKYVIFEISSIIGQILGYKVIERATLDALKQDLFTKDDNKIVKNLVFSHVNDFIDKITKQTIFDKD